MITKKIGVIGFGNMASAIITGALKKGVLAASNISTYDISSEATDRAKKLGIHVAKDNTEVIKNADIILLATKPQYTEDVFANCGKIDADKLFLSIVAGITSERLFAMMDVRPRLIRIMPNTPALVNEGAYGIAPYENATEEDKKEVAEIFSSIGVVEWISESLIDVVTGLSGGGPAYVAVFIEALADGAVKMGLPRKTAYRLAAQTCLGTAKMILDEDMHPGVLKDGVTSPGGTTMAGLQALEDGAFRGTVMDCVTAATEKSKSL
ncbi:pyrroline-5-carboxylate reductase [Aequitasia blattaphilus]|uniref:Pyrroline-5-carboxylate reductase n=1 Tax=Aequitasia blattaphilus TaxID=2949332 RepID=A0ABT1E4R6_9FIRM|nr:pyrroline-5-carboxylate reductase [Aequitasia blattaphilus]MCP1100831.1 pyrroline-5-carboxylate reductase [Aequitasia blattaphilus]MCR8613471.1 pyrroline-5-carboxylate reductase [Aequitasia blattaphilus]